MRIQIIPLPPQTEGESVSIPFLLGIDRLSEEEQAQLTPDDLTHLQDATGAASVLVSIGEIEVGAPLTLSPEHMLHLEAQIAAQIGSVVS